MKNYTFRYIANKYAKKRRYKGYLFGLCGISLGALKRGRAPCLMKMLKEIQFNYYFSFKLKFISVILYYKTDETHSNLYYVISVKDLKKAKDGN